MGAEIAAVAAPAAPPNTLTRRASLNAVASLVDYAAKVIVGLVVTPMLVSGLGRSLFGVWEMLGRLMSYASATDGRPTEALRLFIASRQTDVDPLPRRRLIGAALVVWLLVLPLVAAVGGVLTWFAPALTKVPPDQVVAVRLTCATLVASFVIGSLAAVPESVLRGMNLGYKRMGLQASLNLVGGALAAGAVAGGLGLLGLGGANLVRGLLTGLCFWLVVRSYLSWFGVARPTRDDVKRVLGVSVWLTAGEMIARVLLASDVLVLGVVLSPAIVTSYVLTTHAARLALGIHIFAASAAMPGLGGVIGRQELPRAALARHELLVFTWLFVTGVGATILLWNRTFLTLWVGAPLYAGPVIDVLIVLLTAQTAFIRTDAYIIDAALQPRQRVLTSAAAAVVTIGLSIALTHAFGLPGLCIGMLLGRGVQSVAYPLVARRCLGRPARAPVTGLGRVRLAVVSAALLAGAAVLGQRVTVTNLAVWAGAVPLSLACFTALALIVGLSGEVRGMVLARLRATGRGRRP